TRKELPARKVSSFCEGNIGHTRAKSGFAGSQRAASIRPGAGASSARSSVLSLSLRVRSMGTLSRRVRQRARARFFGGNGSLGGRFFSLQARRSASALVRGRGRFRLLRRGR